MATWTQPWRPQRLLALLLALVGVPAAMGVGAFVQDQPIRAGERAPRTVIAPDLLRVVDREATQQARREAAEEIPPVLVDDGGAKAAIVRDVRDAFAAAADARRAGPDGRVPSPAEQITALDEPLSMLDPRGLRLLVTLGDAQLQQVSSEAVAVAQQLARQRIPEDGMPAVADRHLPAELAVHALPPDIAELVVEPVVRAALRPTVRVDQAATDAARRHAAGEVAEVVRSYPRGTAIVSAGEVVDEVQLAALRQRGLQGAEPWPVLPRAFALAAVLVLAVCAYLRMYRTRVWRSGGRLLLLSCLFLLFALVVEAVTMLAPDWGPSRLYLIPAGAVAMLATILLDPPVGVLVTIPVTALVAFSAPGEPGVVAFAAVASLISVPFVSRLSARGDLRRAAWQSTLCYGALAGAFAGVFGDVNSVGLALLAGLLNGIATAVIVNGLLPFLESLFGIATATSLLDLADRNHPLLRELEQKALGSYNHSITVSTMVERAARAIGADALLVSVAALYHDIGKVRRPLFFVENQFGGANPHDDLEPRVSAVIIQDHVTDGIEMGRVYRLPPEVVDGIATHHGTTLVSYFHRKALDAATRSEEVDEDHFRYKGRKPSTKELAILMLADCCESASRASAMENRNLKRQDLDAIVRRLVADRAEDGQLDESALTFRELNTVVESFIETLVGVYHPRIGYPQPLAPATGGSVGPPAPVQETQLQEAALGEAGGAVPRRRRPSARAEPRRT